MSSGKLVFSQVIDHLPLHTFRQCVKRYRGNHKIKTFTCLDQFLCMAFAQLTYRESLRDIEACLRAQSNKLYHMGIRSQISRNTLSNANRVRDWRIYADLAHSLIPVARKLYQDEAFGLELDQTVYALDATTIDLCLSLFPGPSSDRPRAPSNYTPCWICAAAYRRLSTSRTAKSTKSTSSTTCFWKPVPSTSWIVAISTSFVCTA